MSEFVLRVLTINLITMSNLSSDCCGASPWLDNEDLGRCSKCLECCEFETEEEVTSKEQSLKQLASLLWITCKVKEFGLAGARLKMRKMGLPLHEIQFVTNQMLKFQ